MHVARSIYTVGPVPLSDPVDCLECPTSPNGLHDNSRWRCLAPRIPLSACCLCWKITHASRAIIWTYPKGAAPGPWPIFQGVQVVFPRFRPCAGARAALQRAPVQVRKSGAMACIQPISTRNAAPSPHLSHVALPPASTRECSCTLLPDAQPAIDQETPTPTCAHISGLDAT